MTLDNIKNEIENATSIVILTHESPDGDAIGSSLAMYNALKKIGKDVHVIIPELPKAFAYLEGYDKIEKETSKNYDLAISVDCADIKRLGNSPEYFENAKRTIAIDHHGSNTMYADLNYVNPAFPACCQSLIVILEFLDIEIDKKIGECLLTGIITDTGGFRYQGITKETFEFTAELLSKGVNVSDIYRKALEIKSMANFELTKRATNRLQFYENGKITFTYITNQDLEETKASSGDHEGIVDIGRQVEGVEVAIFARQSEKGYKISLRSNEYVNVSDICFIFGGGGHPRAAGCIMNLPLEQTKQRIIQEVKNNLK